MSKDIKIFDQMYDKIIDTNERTGYIWLKSLVKEKVR